MTVTTPVVGLWSIMDMVSAGGGFGGRKLLRAAGSARLELRLATRVLKDKATGGYTGDPAGPADSIELQPPGSSTGSICNQF